jgi:hypothetical protein
MKKSLCLVSYVLFIFPVLDLVLQDPIFVLDFCIRVVPGDRPAQERVWVLPPAAIYIYIFWRFSSHVVSV